MKLLLITNVFPSPYNATKGTFNGDLARALACDHEVRVVSPVSWVDRLLAMRAASRPGASEAQPRDFGNVAVHYPLYVYPPKLLQSRYGAFYWLSVRGTLRRLVASDRPDAVLGYWAHPDGDAAIRIARRLGVPAVVLVGGSDVLVLTKDPSRRREVQRVLRAADAVVTVSADLRQKIEQLGVGPERVHLWQRGIDWGLFAPGDRDEARARLSIPRDRKALLWVGRMVPVKGLDILLRACALLRQRDVAFHAYLVGDGQSRRPLEAQSELLGLSGMVSFVGPRLHHELPDWFRAADLTVLPSRSEGLPNVLRESLACGTPFVASRVGGIPELAEGGGGEVVPAEDADALANAIARQLARPARARSAQELPTWPEAVQSLLNIIRPLTDTTREPAQLVPSHDCGS